MGLAIMTRTRSGVCLAIACAAILALPATSSAANSHITNAGIVAAAKSNKGFVGWCRVFVNQAVMAASHGKVSVYASNGYNGAFKKAGGTKVSSSKAGPGDIIQVFPNGQSDTNPTTLYPLHTAIVLKNLGSGSFKVIDANFGGSGRWGGYDGRVREHTLNPFAFAGNRGFVTIWRLGPSPSTSKPKPKAPPKAEDLEEEESEEAPEEEETDTAAPSKVSNPAASSATTSSLTLSWGKSTDNVGVSGYNLYRNGSRVTAVGSSTTSYKFTGLSCGTSYQLGVDAYDAAGNRSATRSVTASTSSCSRSVKVSRGSGVKVSGCSSSACAYITVSLSNFGSGSHTVTCYADYPPPTGSFYTYTTSSTTSNVCVYGYAGTHVWVKVDGVESNHLTW